jgi:Ca2+-binding EF-hand superfamily protein
MFNSFDKNQDGKLSFEEFHEMMKAKHQMEQG